MAITFTNIYHDNIISTLSTVLSDEFPIPTYLDEHRGNHSFLVTPESDSLITKMSSGVQREFNIAIEYRVKKGGQYNKNDFKQITNVMERLRRLIHNNSSYNNGLTWFDAVIDSIEYIRDEDDPSILTSTATFNCQHIEAI